MQPRIETLTEKKLVGKRINTSFSDNKTFELWRSFMPRLREIANSRGPVLYSVEVYSPQFFDVFSPETQFEKWAAIEVTDFDSVPGGMETIRLPRGVYAVFLHRGPASAGPKTYEYIFRTWLPNSDFSIDNRPHFALMGERYKRDDPDSEEEIWIPIKHNKPKETTEEEISK
jgi:AraC family transcriptional regulator